MLISIDERPSWIVQGFVLESALHLSAVGHVDDLHRLMGLVAVMERRRGHVRGGHLYRRLAAHLSRHFSQSQVSVPFPSLSIGSRLHAPVWTLKQVVELLERLAASYAGGGAGAPAPLLLARAAVLALDARPEERGVVVQSLETLLLPLDSCQVNTRNILERFSGPRMKLVDQKKKGNCGTPKIT